VNGTERVLRNRIAVAFVEASLLLERATFACACIKLKFDSEIKFNVSTKTNEEWFPLDSCVRISGDTGMPTQYIPIFIFAALAAAFPAMSLILFKFIRPTPVATGAKLKPYECGVDPEGDTRGRYSVRFYIVAILFVIFDVETTFLFPWAVLFSTREPGFRLPEIYALASMFVFLGILIIGYVWLYRKGALEWV
jgi:NADH-quinone oxidoreductase subunit A